MEKGNYEKAGFNQNRRDAEDNLEMSSVKATKIHSHKEMISNLPKNCVQFFHNLIYHCQSSSQVLPPCGQRQKARIFPCWALDIAIYDARCYFHLFCRIEIVYFVQCKMELEIAEKSGL